ncbi:hypothetical protein ACFYZ4_00160 [Streptomyces sp. NPDC001513]|uniref:hypothetical protein n=1 Tax=Streptomyces sp. NPDC001513 TaxID=3364580 RepID=UPI0036D1E074
MLVTLDRLIAGLADRIAPPTDAGTFGSGVPGPEPWNPRTWARAYRHGHRRREQRRTQGLRVPTARPAPPPS